MFLTGCAALLAGALAVAPANPHLAAAEKALGDLDYSQAEQELGQARHAPTSRAERLHLLEMLGEVEAILGKKPEAEAAFRELLVLEPAHAAPARWAPKVKTPFFSAKAWAADHPALELKALEPELQAGKLAALKLELGPDPLGLASKVRLHQAAAGKEPATTELPTSGPLSVPAAAPDQVRYWAELLDADGGTLLSLGDEAHPQIAQGQAAKAPEASVSATPSTGEARPAFRPLAYGLMGGGVAAIGVGAIFGARVRSAQSSVSNASRDDQGRITSVTRAAALDLDRQARRDAVIANTLFALGGVAAAAGVGLFVAGTFVSAAPSPEGVALAAELP